MPTFETVLAKHIRPFGKWQLIVILIINIPSFPFIFFQTLAHTPPPHRCRIPSLDNSSLLSWDEVRQLAIPSKAKESPPAIGQEYKPCEQFDLPFNELVGLNFSQAWDRVEKIRAKHKGNVSIIPCLNGYAYDEANATYRHSLGEEFNLVCDKAPLLTFTSSVYMPGMTLGLVVAGYTADWIGRRRALVIYGLYNLIVSLIIPFSVNIYMYIVMRFLLAMACNSHGIVGYILWIELLDDNYRTTLNIMTGLYYSLFSRGLFTLMAWLIQDWRYLAFSMNWCLLPVFLYMTPLMTESPRWLLSRGYTDQANALIRRVVKINRGEQYIKDLEETDPDALKCHCLVANDVRTPVSNKEFLSVKVKRLVSSLSVLFTTRRVRQRSILAIVQFSFQVVAYYSLAFYAIHIEGNAYVISFVEGLMALPAAILMYILYHRYKRRGPINSMHGLSAVICFIAALMIYLKNKGSLVVVVLANVVICLQETAFNMFYVFLPECFPTEIRNTAFSTASGLSRIAGMSSSYIEQLDQTVWPPLPMIVIGVLCGCMIGFIYLLPETKGVYLSDTIVELEMRPTVYFKRNAENSEETVQLANGDFTEEE